LLWVYLWKPVSMKKLPLHMKEKIDLDPVRCTAHHMAINDTMDVYVLKEEDPDNRSLGFGKQRFMELKANIDGIAAKMLSKELQQLELNGLVTRTVLDTRPITVEYNLTEFGHSLQPILMKFRPGGSSTGREL